MKIIKLISIVLIKLTALELWLKSEGFWANYKCISTMLAPSNSFIVQKLFHLFYLSRLLRTSQMEENMYKVNLTILNGFLICM